MIADKLAEIPLFASLSRHDREQIARAADEVEVDAGKHLAEQGRFAYEFMAIEEGTAAQGDLDLLLDVCDRILGKCLCPLGDAAAMPVASYIDKFRAEFQEHVDSGCPMGGSSSLEGILAPVDQHTHAPVAEVPA